MESLRVLRVDNHVLAVAKPAGLPTVPDASGDASLLDLAKAWVRAEFAKPGEVFLGVVQRLDRPVSGVVVFGRTSKGAARLSEQLRTRRAHKRYLALCQGQPVGNAREGSCEAWLAKDERANVVRRASPGTPGARLASTRWRCLASRGDVSLLELEPLTGRAHQLRACAAQLGAPILGDLKYGARAPLADRSIALHARLLEFDHPTRPERCRVACDAPATPWWGEFARELSALADPPP